MMKETIHQEDEYYCKWVIANAYIPDIRTFIYLYKYIKQILTSEGRNSNVIRARDFNTPFPTMTEKQKGNIEIKLHIKSDWLSDIHRTFRPTAEDTFSSNTHKPFSKMLGHKISLNKFKKTEIILSIFSKHNSIELKINYKRKTGKFPSM